MHDRRTLLSGTVALGVAGLTGCAPRGTRTEEPATSNGTTSTPTGDAADPVRLRVAGTIATGLNVPWGIAFRPDGAALVAQRDRGSIVLVEKTATGSMRVVEVGEVPDTVGRRGGEAGLLGLALDPDDPDVLFAFVSTEQDERIVRTTLSGGRLGSFEPILTGIPTGGRHHGGRLAFGPDGFLYVGTGEAGRPPLAQDANSLGGKILRITKDGDPAPGNPFNDAIWSLGHRNVEGLAFDGAGRLWACEFGENTFDELNLILKGRNYGWPEYEGRSNDARFVSPKVVWSTSECSPSGMAILGKTAYVAALRGERLWSVPLNGTDVGTPRAHFKGTYGRLRTVVAAPDGSLWVTTSNTDGRGREREGDDRILRVVVS